MKTIEIELTESEFRAHSKARRESQAAKLLADRVESYKSARKVKGEFVAIYKTRKVESVKVQTRAALNLDKLRALGVTQAQIDAATVEGEAFPTFRFH